MTEKIHEKKKIAGIQTKSVFIVVRKCPLLKIFQRTVKFRNKKVKHGEVKSTS